MNEETRQFVTSKKLLNLYDELHKKHKPIKSKYSPEVLNGIGLVVACFQRLEYTISYVITVLLNKLHEKDIIELFLNKVPFKDLVTIMVAISSRTEWKHKEKLIELSKLAKKSEEIRNKLIHSLWFSDGRMKKTLNEKHGKVDPQFEKYDRNDLLQIADTIDKIDTSINALTFAYIEDKLACGEEMPGVKALKY
jgi:hypothetical protein